MTRPGLAELQRLFHDAITGRRSLAEARTLVRDDGVDPIARLGVYAHAYFVRIRDAIAAEYPKLAAILGDDGFTSLVSAYLERYPTFHPSLREAGLTLPRFLDEPGEWRGAHAWYADLARLERARTDCFDGPDATALRRDQVAAIPPEGFAAVRLRLIPSSAIVAMTWNADELWAALEEGAPVPAPVSTVSTVLVWCRDLTVVHRRLAADEASALARVTSGATFAEICELLSAHATPVERAIQLLLGWIDAEILA